MPKPVFLWGDTPLLLLGLESVLANNGYDVKRRSLQKDNPANDRLRQTPAIVILQLGKQGGACQSIIQRFLKSFPQSKLLLVGKERDQKRIKTFFKAGIRGYALPSLPPEYLLRALQQIERNKPFIDPQLSEEWTQYAIGVKPAELKLTRREKEVLQLIVEEYTTKEIAVKLFISQCTAETHRLNIIHKLGVRNTAGVVREAIRLGWCA